MNNKQEDEFNKFLISLRPRPPRSRVEYMRRAAIDLATTSAHQSRRMTSLSLITRGVLGEVRPSRRSPKKKTIEDDEKAPRAKERENVGPTLVAPPPRRRLKPKP